MKKPLFYKVKIANRDVALPVKETSGGVSFALLDLNLDRSLTESCADALAWDITYRLEEKPDFIVCAESKGVCLGYEMATVMSTDLLIVRKEPKWYYTNKEVSVCTLTGDKVHKLYIPDIALRKARGKKVVLVDDVVSTGSTFNALDKFFQDEGVKVIGHACVLAEGGAEKKFPDLLYLGTIPLM